MPAIFKNGVEYVSTTNAASISVGLGQNVNLNLQDTVQHSLNNFAPIEYSPSQHSYATGDLLVLNGILYRVISNISVGNNLLINSNIQRITVENAIQKQLSFVGMIVMSTTLDSELRVQEIYGSDTSWILHTGYMLRGATQGVTGGLNHNTSDGGEATVTLSSQEMPVHTHTDSGHTHTDSGHTHSIGGHTHQVGQHTHTIEKHTHSVGQHKHTVTVKVVGPYPTMGTGGIPGYAIASSGGSSNTSLITTSNNTAYNTGENYNNKATVTAKNANYSTGQNTAFTSASGKANLGNSNAVIQNAGGGQPHNNMPPYKNVYIWQRVA